MKTISMKYVICSLLVALVFFTSCSENLIAQEEKRTVQAQHLDSLFNFSHSNGMFNGAVMVAKNDTLIYKKAFGYANKETKVEISTESIFYIASVSKQVTAMGIMMLQEQGKLSFDDKIKVFFPNYPAYLQDITIRQLLNHTSGLTDTEYYKLTNPSNEDVLEILMKQDSLELENGKTFRYSNSGYVMLALIIQQLAEKPIDQFFDEEIFKPLEMENTTATKSLVEASSQLVIGYNQIGTISRYGSSVIGPGGIYSTVDDLEKWNRALNSNELVSSQTLSEAFKNGELSDGPISITMNGETYGYGFGWMPYQKNGRNYVQHDGTVEGYRSLIKKNLTDGYDYTFLTNHGNSLAMDELTKAIDSILEKSEYIQPKIPIANLIVKELEAEEVTIAIRKIKRAISKNPEAYKIDESSINGLAYTYLRDDQKNIAVEVFKLNSEVFPNSFNAFDSLAEVYFSIGQFGLSKANYGKSLVLNPDNTNARDMIDRIEKATPEIN
ncbi:serine hydrolase domain-containing protein [Algoriphagus ratkowskyi]|nr:serine hydrolase domain-containing protein [Algoriphagus ratkowskyi]